MKSRRTAGPDPESTVSRWCTAVAHACPRCVPRVLGGGQREAHTGGVQALAAGSHLVLVSGLTTLPSPFISLAAPPCR